MFESLTAGGAWWNTSVHENPSGAFPYHPAVPQSCAICGKAPSGGNQISRRGLPKYQGGIGLKTTGITKRRFRPNLQRVRAVVDGTRRRVRVCVKCLRAGRVQKAGAGNGLTSPVPRPIIVP